MLLLLPYFLAGVPSSPQPRLVAKPQPSAELMTADSALLKAFEVVAEQPRFKPTICWNCCVLLKQEGGSSSTAAPGPTSLSGAPPGAQRHSWGSAPRGERLGIITRVLVPHAAFPECTRRVRCLWNLQGKAGAESSPVALPVIPSVCRQRCCLTHTCCRISRKSCNENLDFQSQGGLFSSKECPFPQWNTQDSQPDATLALEEAESTERVSSPAQEGSDPEQLKIFESGYGSNSQMQPVEVLLLEETG